MLEKLRYVNDVTSRFFVRLWYIEFEIIIKNTIMKQLVIIAALTLISSFGFAQDIQNTQMPETISQIVDYPSGLDLDQNNNFALVEFSVSQDGILNVSNINASQELKNYILEKLNGYSLIDAKAFCGLTFQYKLTFQK